MIWDCQTERHIEREEPVKLKPESQEPEDFEVEWRTNVVNYTCRDMTFDTDRLVALSGVAQVMAEKRKDQSLAGLWKSSLVRDLLWHASPWVERPPPAGYLAPSWSWASLGGPVIWNEYSKNTVLETYVEAIAAETVPKSPVSPFGDVESGFVTIRGPVIEVQLYFDESVSESGVHIIGDWEEGSGHFVLPDARLYEADGLNEDGTTVQTYRRAQAGEEYERYTDENGDALTYSMRVSVLCFLRTKGLDIVGLVLGRSTKAPGAYTRLGPAWKIPAEYVKRAIVKELTIA